MIFKTRCPQLVEYARQVQEAAGDEYAALRTKNEAANLRRLVDDYGELRAQCRALEDKGR